MYKQSLKRSQHFVETKLQNPPSSAFDKISERVQRSESDILMIPSRLLDTPNNKGKDKKAVLAPLFAQSHPYPSKIPELLESNQQSQKSIGAYKEVNWISIGNKVEFWITGETTSVAQQFNEEISCLAVGELKASSLPHKIRDHYILAVGIKNQVLLYCLESFTLRLWEIGLKYTLDFSWQVQRIQFIDGFRMIFFSTPNYLQMVQFGEVNRVVRTFVPFYRKYLPTNFSQPEKIVENILYSKNRIYILFTQIKERLWVVNAVRKLIDQDAHDPYIRTKVIQSYSIGETGIEQIYKISQEDLKRRIKNYAPGWKSDEVKILNIFIDKDGKEQELGIMTNCGVCLTLRDMGKVYFSKDPVFLQNTITYESAFLLSEVTPFSYKIDKENPSCEVFASLGCNSLTLTKDSLLWVGNDRVDGIHGQNLVAEMLLRRSTPSYCYLFNTNDWAVFTRQAFYTIRQLPIRHYLIAIIYVSITQLDEYEPLSCQNTSYKQMMQRIQKALTPQIMLRHLVQILISGERHISVNNIVLELVQRELRGEGPQNYRDWPHDLKPSLAKKEIHITNDILSKIWNLVFVLQYKQLPQNIAKSKQICDVSVYWLAIHEIYHNLVSPLYKFTPSQFKANKQLIENTFNSLNSLQNFFDIKFRHENLIRQYTIDKLSKESFGEDVNQTQDSFNRQTTDVSWVEETACRTITSKIMSENIIQVQERLKKAVNTTLNLMTIYFGLSSNEVKLPSFGEILRNRNDQHILAKVIISRSDFTTLVDIDRKMPQLQLKKDIQFKRWANNLPFQQNPESNVNLQQLASVINSNYFQESLKLLGNRYDLQIKMLEIYEEILLSKKNGIIQTNTLKQRNFLSNTLFPEDQETFLSYQRDNFNYQLERIIQQEKKCLRQAALALSQQKQDGKWSKIMDELIMIAANKPLLYDHLQNELKFSGNLEKFSKLQKFKYKEYHKYAYNKKINPKPRPIERQLFPHP